MATDDSLVRTLLLIIAVILLVPFLLMIVMMPAMGMWGAGHMWNGAVPTWMGVLIWLVFLLVLLGIGYLLYGAIQRSDEQPDDALEELRLAYARGELSDEEYENRRERLERNR